MIKSSKLRKLIIWLLYLLPVIFFAICYFLLTATEEDIAQGCGTAPDVLNDLIGAFRSDARISDMYAWAVINFFDYQYSFGIDTIFRLLDVLAVTGVLLLLTSLILGHRPRQKLKDALVFMGCFLLLVLTPYGYTFYRGFSMIHNYLIISLALLGFSLPFIRKLTNSKIPKLYHRWWIALPLGLVFGMSANFPPIAFIATYVIVKIWQLWQNKKHNQRYRIRPEAWECLMIGGMLVSMLFGYIVGPGVSRYASDPMYVNTYDYVAIGDILQNFGGSVARIAKHVIFNFARTMGPIVIILLLAWIVACLVGKIQHRKIKLLPDSLAQKRLLLCLAIFSCFSTLIGSQIIMPVRLCLPAYLALIVAATILIVHWWQEFKSRELAVLYTIMICLAVAAIIIVKTIFAWDFHVRIGEVLATIKNSEDDVIYINPDILQQRPKIPFNMFQQEETFVRRQENGYNIYGKHIVYDTTLKD